MQPSLWASVRATQPPPTASLNITLFCVEPLAKLGHTTSMSEVIPGEREYFFEDLLKKRKGHPSVTESRGLLSFLRIAMESEDYRGWVCLFEGRADEIPGILKPSLWQPLKSPGVVHLISNLDVLLVNLKLKAPTSALRGVDLGPWDNKDETRLQLLSPKGLTQYHAIHSLFWNPPPISACNWRLPTLYAVGKLESSDVFGVMVVPGLDQNWVDVVSGRAICPRFVQEKAMSNIADLRNVFSCAGLTATSFDKDAILYHRATGQVMLVPSDAMSLC